MADKVPTKLTARFSWTLMAWLIAGVAASVVVVALGLPTRWAAWWWGWLGVLSALALVFLTFFRSSIELTPDGDVVLRRGPITRLRTTPESIRRVHVADTTDTDQRRTEWSVYLELVDGRRRVVYRGHDEWEADTFRRAMHAWAAPAQRPRSSAGPTD